MKKVTSILIVALLMVVMIGCDKAAIEPNGYKVEVGFNAKHYTVEYEGGLKGAAALPGWPDIPHLTDLNQYEGYMNLWHESEYGVDFSITLGGWDTLSVELENGIWYMSNNTFYYPINVNQFYTEIPSYIASIEFNEIGIPPQPPITVDSANTIITFNLLPYHNSHCFVFNDPDGIIEEVTYAGNPPNVNEGIIKSQMNTVTDVNGTFHYFYGEDRNLWVHTTGGRLTINFADYLTTLTDAEKLVYFNNGQWEMNERLRPFTVYCTIHGGGGGPQIQDITFGVLNVYPHTEVIIDPS